MTRKRSSTGVATFATTCWISLPTIPATPARFRRNWRSCASLAPIRKPSRRRSPFCLAQYIKDCFCAAFLPPCPCPVEDAGVPLAAITVSKANGVCRIVSICNLEVRKFATTFPNLAYWLSVFPFARDIKKALASVCCKPLIPASDSIWRSKPDQPLRHQRDVSRSCRRRGHGCENRRDRNRWYRRSRRSRWQIHHNHSRPRISADS